MKLLVVCATSLLLALSLSLSASCGGTTVQECSGTIVNGKCVITATGDACDPGFVLRNNACVPADDGSGGSPDDGPNPPGPDNGGGSDEGTVPDEGEGPCAPGLAGTKPLGSGCGAHCECKSGYCYDENYLDGFRFCSEVPTFAGCEEAGVALILGGQLANEKGLVTTAICVPTCKTLEDCLELSSAYDTCGNPDTGKTDSRCNDHTVYTQKTCQIISACYP